MRAFMKVLQNVPKELISLPHDLFRFHLTTSIMSYGNNDDNNNYIHVMNIHNDGDDGKIAIGNLQ